MKKKLKLKNFNSKELNFKNGELFQRMNYLLQLSTSVLPNFPHLSRVYSHMVKDISKRNALRMDSKVRHLICEKCCNNLIFDKQSYIEMTTKSGKHLLQIKCNNCFNTCEIILF